MTCPACASPLQELSLGEGLLVDTCPSCGGVFYDAAELAVRLEVTAAAPGARACPRDGTAMVKGVVKGSDVEIDGCTACGGVWLDQGEVQRLREALKVDRLVGKAPPPLPVTGASSARPVRAAASLGDAQAAKEELKRRARAEKQAEPRDSGAAANPDAVKRPTVEREGQSFEHFQTCWPKVTFVVGEFPWQVKVGDEAQIRDFISPPWLLSEELTGKDRTWSLGRYLEPEEVWSGFGLEGAPPAGIGAAPAQPNPHEESWRAMRPWLWGALAGAVALYLGLASLARRQVVLSQDYAFDLRSTNPERSFVTPDFELAGGPSSVKVRLDTNMENNWAFFRMALINADTDVALDFDREVSYYHGVDDGESWSEGARDDEVYLPRVPGGRYYLRVEPESEGSFSYHLTLTRDEPRLLHLFAALAALLLPAAWVAARRHVFEVARWAESDHPMSSSSNDDGDDD